VRAITPALDRIVRHCLEKRPSERFQTARDVAFALDSLSVSSSSASAPAMSDAPARPRGSHERLAWMAATAALAVLAGGSRCSARAEPPQVSGRMALPREQASDRIPGRRIACPRRAAAGVLRTPDGEGVPWVQALDATRDTVPGRARRTRRSGRGMAATSVFDEES
jgi:hypothetical protein